MPPTARFCSGCGAPAPAPLGPDDSASVEPPRTAEVGSATGRRSITPFVLTAVVLLALVIGGLAIVRSAGDESDGDDAGSGAVDPTATTVDSASASTTPPSSTTTPPETTATSELATADDAETADDTQSADGPTTTPAPTQPPDPDAAALISLAGTIETDRPSVDAHLGRWVPQVSAKRNGLAWEGVDYGFVEIQALHADLDERYGTLLIDGSEYNFRLDGAPMVGWFVTIVDRSFPSSDGALDWCRANRIDRDNCAAKLITNDPDAEATLVLQ